MAFIGASGNRRALFIDEDYWTQSEKRVTPFDFEDDEDSDAFMTKFRHMEIASSDASLAGDGVGDLEDIAGHNSKTVSTNVPGSGTGASSSQVLSTGITAGVANKSTPSNIASLSHHKTLQDALTRPAVKSADAGELAAEVAYLRRRLAESQAGRDSPPPPPAVTARRLAAGQPCVLEVYRSLADKQQLLEHAVQLGDGDAILAVVLFLKRSLKRSLFHAELRCHPAACRQYVSYLRSRFSYTEAIDLLAMLGQTEHAAMLKYEAAVKTKDPGQLVKNLQNCLQTHFSSDPDLAVQADYIREQIDLIERQRPVEASTAVTGLPPGAEPPKLVGKSVISTLLYCCTYHYHQPVNQLASPLAVRERHQLTDRQYVWTALRARAAQHDWPQIQLLFTSKSWFGSGRLRPVVSFERVVEVLNSVGTPPDVLSTYLGSVDGLEKRISLGKKYGCYRIVVDGYVSQKDRLALEQYKSSLSPQTPAYLYAADALRATTIKWKN